MWLQIIPQLYSYLEAKFDGIQIYGVGIVDVVKSLSEWINSDLLSQLQRLSNVFLPDTLDTQVGKLHCHVLTVHIHGADTLLAPLTDTFTVEDRCRLALEHCEAESIVNFYRMYFCTMQANNWLFYPVGVSDYFLNA